MITVVNGEITEVMETWPLQLIVRTAEGDRRQVSLSDDVTVAGPSGPLGPGDLRPGMAIRLTGTSRRHDELTARLVQVVGGQK